MKFSFTASIVLLISIVIIFYVVYPYLTQLEAPLWILQFTFYALMTAVFGFIFLGILAPLVREHLEIAKMKKIEDKHLLEALKNEYTRCAWSIDTNIKEIVEKNKRSEFTASLYKSSELGDLKTSEDLEKQVKDYDRRFQLYKVLQHASMRFVVSAIEIRVKEQLPKSSGNSVPIKNMLSNDFLMVRFLNGEKVTENWLKDSDPETLKKIVKEIEESERDTLDVFFHKLNRQFEDDDVLLRFRNEKEELIKHGKETISNFQKEISSIDEQLKKYSNLRTTRVEEKPSQWKNV
jgi:hypothetical protein